MKHTKILIQSLFKTIIILKKTTNLQPFLVSYNKDPTSSTLKKTIVHIPQASPKLALREDEANMPKRKLTLCHFST